MKKDAQILILSPFPSTSGGVTSYVNALKENWNVQEKYFFRGNAGNGKFKKLANTASRYLLFAFTNAVNPMCNYLFVNTSMDKKAFRRDRIFIMIAKLLFKKVFVFVHGWDQSFFENIPQKKLKTFFRADKIFVLSRDFKAELERRGYAKKIVVETTVVERSFIAEFPLPEASHIEGTRFLYLARLEEEKGVLLLIDAFQRLSKRYQNIHLDIAGFGSLEESVKRRLAAYANPRIAFHGMVKGKEKTNLFQRCNVYVLPTSHGEGMPISILEAMAAGLAVITTSAGALKDFFKDGRMGFKMKGNSPYELEEKMEEAILTEGIGELGDYNYRYARDHFTVKKVIERLENEIWGSPLVLVHKQQTSLQ